MVTISKMGTAVTDDKCWQLKTALNDSQFAAFKQKYDNKEFASDYKALKYWQDTVIGANEDYKRTTCTCLGPKIFTDCKFPGVTKDYTAEDQAAVQNPAPLQPTQPAKNATPPDAAPTPPGEPPKFPTCNLQQDQTCPQQQKDWGSDYKTWGYQYQDWGNEFKAWGDKMDAYKTKMDQYQADMDKYQTAVTEWGDQKKDWQTRREKAVGNAEGLIRKLYEDYGSTFNSDLVKNWIALCVIMAVFFVLIFVAQKYKDYAGR